MGDRSSAEGLLASLERLLQIPTGDLKTTMIQASDLIAECLHADKVDVFLYDAARDSLSAICSSSQALSALQHKPGLDLVDVAELVRESARALETPHTNIKVPVQSMGRILVVADGARVRQCIDNLISNAVEKSPQGGTVTVAIGTETTDDGEHARIQVIDEGPVGRIEARAGRALHAFVAVPATDRRGRPMTQCVPWTRVSHASNS